MSRAGRGRTGKSGAGQGSAGQGREGRGSAGQDREGRSRVDSYFMLTCRKQIHLEKTSILQQILEVSIYPKTLYQFKVLIRYILLFTFNLEFHRKNRTHRAASGRDTSSLQHQVFRPDAARCVRFPQWNSSFRFRFRRWWLSIISHT